MRKNRMMRLASALLILTMVTTCAISGTFAKYVTEDSATDTARVAKWGMTVEVVGNLFGANYHPYSSTDATSNKISAVQKNSVDAADGTTTIVAPGTESDKGMTLSVKGDPEVAYTVAYADEGTIQTIWLKTGNYATLVKTEEVTADNFAGYYYVSGGSYKVAAGTEDFATLGSEWYEIHDKVTVTENSTGKGTYNPIEWTITDNATSNTTKYREASAVATALKGYFTASGAANAEIDKNYTVTWKWEFDQGQNGADTVLGNLMADTDSDNYVVVNTNDDYKTCAKVDAAGYNLNISFGAKITATQVD